MWPLSSLGDWSVQGVANIYITDRLNYLALHLLLLNIGRPRKEKMFRFSICDVRQFISRRTFCQPLSSPLLCSLWWCLPQFSCLSLASFLLSLLLPACFLFPPPPLYSRLFPHLCLLFVIYVFSSSSLLSVVVLSFPVYNLLVQCICVFFSLCVLCFCFLFGF